MICLGTDHTSKMSGASVNFQLKSNKKIPLIPGTRTCVGRSRTLISSGIISLDCILGGGFPVRDIILVEEDDSGFYGQLFIKYFISEGVVCGHNGFLASLDSDTNKIASELPAPVLTNIPPSDNQNSTAGNNVAGHIDKSSDLKIAWRYYDTPVVQSSSSSVFGHQFDLAEKMPPDIINNAELFHWQPDHDVCTNYQDDLLKALEERLNKGGHRLLDENKPLRRTVLRIAIHSAGSPLWGSPFHLPQFFYRLRLLVDSSLSVCLITVPSRIIQAAVSTLSGEDCKVNIIGRCQHLSDWALKLESLADNDDPAYAEYSGLIYLNKLSTKNRLAPHIPDTTDWAFKLRKRRFIIEKLHLPPELGETVQREQDDSASIGCYSTNTTNKLDF